MASNTERLIEANKRGLLTGEKKARFDEAVTRGLIKLPVEQQSAEDVASPEIPQGISPQRVQQMQRTVESPADNTVLGAFLSGAQRGMENIGEGILQRGAEAGGALGYDTQKFKDDLSLSGDIAEQRLKSTREAMPLSTGAGEIAGTVAAFPVAPAKVGQAIAAGGVFGAVQPTDKPLDMAMNIVQDAAFGGLGAAAAPYLQKGFNKGQALFSSLYKKITGADPRPEMFMPDGNLSDAGKSAMGKVGISEEDFTRLYGQLDEKLEPVSAMRLARAEEQGIPLTTAQATKDFSKQEAEQTLRSNISREGEAARQVEAGQQEAIGKAQQAFEGGFGEVTDREARGGIVQDALRGMEKEGRKDVSALYTKAKESAGTATPIDNASLLDTIDTNIIDRNVSDSTLNTVESALAKFGLIDGEISQAGRFNQIVGSDGKAVKFKGEQTPLTLDNAEEFRQKLTAASQGDESGAITQMINKLDQVVDDAVNALPGGSAKTEAFQAARSAHREQKEIFASKDIIQNLVDYKKGTRANKIDPDRVIDSILKGANSGSNLQRVKNTLMKNPNNKTVDAWKSIQAQGAADIFGQSINPATGDISGQRLVTAIKKFGGGSTKEGEKRLKILFGEKYGQFDNLVKAIGDATIPVKGTTNPSGTAYKLLNFMARVGSVGTFGADAVIPMINKVKDSASSKRVLQQIQKAQPDKIKQAVKSNDEMIDAFVRLGTTGTLRDQPDKVNERK